jgi:CRP/FNR family transcriptional regulator, cyclic AMP receptor protein
MYLCGRFVISLLRGIDVMGSNFAELQPNVEALGSVRDFINEFIEAVKTQRLLQGFSRQEVALLSEYLECFGVPRHSTVVREGDEGNFLAILVTGKAMILKSHAGIDKVVQELKPGDLIGAMSFLDGQKRFTGCLTIEPSDFAVLTQDNLNAMLADHPRLGNKFLLMLLGLTNARLRHTTTMMLPGLAEANLFE